MGMNNTKSKKDEEVKEYIRMLDAHKLHLKNDKTANKSEIVKND